MVTSYMTSLAEATMNDKWTYFWGITSGTTWTNQAGGSLVVSPAIFIGFTGAAFAFILSVLGAISNAGKTMYEVEDALDDWLKGYGKGKYEDILKDVEKSESMQTFLNAFTIDMVIYSLTSFAHSFFLISVGFVSAYTIFSKVVSLEKSEGSGNIPMLASFKHLLFGVLIGTVDYFAGNVAKNTAYYIMLSMGFNDHSYTNLENTTTETTTVSKDGISLTTEVYTKPATKVAYDYKKLLKMQDEWYDFFAIQRGM